MLSSDPPFVVLKTSTNALTLLFPFHSLSISASAITNLSFHPKNITPTSSLLRLIILTVSGKLSICYSIGNRHSSYLHLLHLRLSQTVLLLFSNKIHKLRLSLTAISAVLSPHSLSPPVTPPQFSSFRSASESEISKILLNCPNSKQTS